jgi:hypothetical protein
LDVADHVHGSPLVVTPTEPPPPAAVKLAVAGLNAVSHAAAAWVTSCVWPFAVIVAVRAATTAFAATVYSIAPLVPAPDAPLVITSHDASDVADHVHVSPLVVTLTEPLPPAAATLAVVGLNATPHSAAAWVTSCIWPFAVIVAVRAAAIVFAATVYAIVPLVPVPEAPLVITSHDASDVADHVQVSPLVVTDTLPLPPAESKDAVAGARAEVQFSAWITTCASPAIVTVVTRAPPLFALTVINTLPLPVPDIGSTSIQSALSDTLHEQVPALAVTPTLCVPPPAATL